MNLAYEPGPIEPRTPLIWGENYTKVILSHQIIQVNRLLA